MMTKQFNFCLKTESRRVLPFLLLTFLALQVSAQKGSLYARTQASLEFITVGPQVAFEIGDLDDDFSKFRTYGFDQTLFLQVHPKISIGLGLGLSQYEAKQDTKGIFETDETPIHASYYRMFLAARIQHQFPSRFGMFHEVQIRSEIGKFDRVSLDSRVRVFGDMNIFGVGYSPIFFYRLREGLLLEATFLGAQISKIKAIPNEREDDIFFLPMRVRLRTGIMLGVTYKLSN